MQPNRRNESVVITPGRAQRSNVPVRLEDPAGPPAAPPAGVPVMPTARPRRAARRRGPINPIYLLLVTVVPLVLLGVMVWAAAAQYTPPSRPEPQALIIITPVADLAPQIALTYNPDAAAATRDGDQVLVSGQVKNNTSLVVHGVYLKAFLYRPDGLGGQEAVGSGVGNAVGDIAPGASAPFTVTAQLSRGPGVKLGTPTPLPQDFKTVQIFVDQVWSGSTPTPQNK